MKKFGIVDKEVMQDPDLSLTVKGVYGLLSTFANKNRVCYPSTTLLAELAGVNRRTIERALSVLQKKGYVTKQGKSIVIR